jgi:hypothetical protein
MVTSSLIHIRSVKIGSSLYALTDNWELDDFFPKFKCGIWLFSSAADDISSIFLRGLVTEPLILRHLLIQTETYKLQSSKIKNKSKP